MPKSLQDQLLNAGLVDKKKAKSINKEQRKNKKQQQKGHQQEDETKLAAQKALKEKSERDKAINKKRNEEAEKIAIRAQIKQLVGSHQIDRMQGNLAYQFNDAGKIKKINVSDIQQKQLASGLIAIAKLDDTYYLLPKAVAEKIAVRDQSIIVVANEKDASIPAEDDPYADYQIPDDLMW